MRGVTDTHYIRCVFLWISTHTPHARRDSDKELAELLGL